MSTTSMMNRPSELIINLAGDVMIGRLIDQLLPISVNNPEEASIVRQFRSSRSSYCPYLEQGKYTYETIWGNTLPLWKQGNLNIINLETSITTHDKLWPKKMFNYRSHPSNVACLTAANIHHVSLANNHTLDFGIKGLEETCHSLDKSSISYVGAGRTRADALGPVYLDIPLKGKVISVHSGMARSSDYCRVAFLSISDHPSDWNSIESFHLLSTYDLRRVSAQLSPLIKTARTNADLVIFSIHWGPNYQWIPDEHLQHIGRWMINEGVDIIHGHSSHHIQGIEIIPRSNRNPGLIIYGCGDFLDDYAVNREYRNDLGALFQLHLSHDHGIHLHSISIYPTRCSNFQVNQLDSTDSDWIWIKEKFMHLSDIGQRTWTQGLNNDLFIQL